jgi:hypothetical protein
MNDKNNKVCSLFIEKVEYPVYCCRIFVWVESKQLCMNINTSLKIKKYY